MNGLIALVIGLLAGAHSATWGMYKDSPHEGFTYVKYFRSIVLSGIIATVAWMIIGFDVSRAPNMIILFGLTYAIERAMLEFYKTFLRTEDQSKYFIPMQFHVFGRVVESKGKRLLLGFAYLVVVAVALAAVAYIQNSGANIPSWVVIVTIGSVGGWISAFGGAWEDGPIEGFEIFKFFRSPAISAIYATLAVSFTQNYLLIAACGLGYTVATIETYKTFFFPSKPRGKFQGKEIKFPEMLQRRQKFIPVYLTIWLVIIITVIAAFNQPHSGLI